MSADLYIHIYERLTEDDLKAFFSNTLGSKYFSLYGGNYKKHNDAYEKISKTPHIWIGEVSWLKAAFCKDDEEASEFIPDVVDKIHELIGEELPVIDDEMISKVQEIFKLPNNTSYDVTKEEKVVKFLEEHKGNKVFTVSW